MIIDVSVHNGDLDWNALKPQIEGAIIRCGYGSDRTDQDDKKWAQNVAACESLGIPFGVYLYSYAPNEEMARSEARHVLRLVSGHKLALPVFFDAEEKKYGYAARKNFYAFEETIRAAGIRVGLYTGEYFYNTYMHGTSSEYLWIAKYGTNNGQPQKQPALADGHAFQLWQYTSKAMGGHMDASQVMDRNIFAPEAPKKSVSEIAAEVLAGKWGNGDDRKNRLTAAGYDYSAVQAAVNASVSKPKKSVDEIAAEVIAGQWGNGSDRKARLVAAGYDYDAVQAAVNKKTAKKSTTEIAKEVIAGKWGNGADRKRRLAAAGYDYAAVQAAVNKLA